MTLWRKIKNRMADYPESEIREDEEIFTYTEFSRSAEEMAAMFTGSCYAILCRKQIHTAQALLACLAAGVPAVPLSHRYGQSHIDRILEKVQPEYLITDDDGFPTIHKLNEPTEFDSEKPALILCTSGTEGTLKGVMLSDQNIITNLDDIQSYFDLTSYDRILIARPLYHCAVLTGEFLLSLLCGVNIVFDSAVLNPEHLIGKLIEHRITVFCGTPTLLSLIARMMRGREELLLLRKIAVSGECMTEHTAKMIAKGFHRAQIFHVYGLTEASPRVAYLPPRLFSEWPCSVGFLLPSLKGIIADEHGNELPMNTVGELLISGPSIMQGYYRDTEATNRVLRDGWLHTGDLAFMDDHGILTIKGRKDDLIIYAGMNIYPAEIENALKQDVRVRDVLAYGYPDKLCGQRIGIQIAGDFDSKEEIELLCVENLSAYARPSKIDWVKELPKNGSGKIIRKKPTE